MKSLITSASVPAKYKGNELAFVKEQTRLVRTAGEVVRLQHPLIAEAYEDQLVKMLIELNEFLNIKFKMNQAQITETVCLLFEEYPRMSLQEYSLFFRRIKTGYFGPLYETLDGLKIMTFMKDYYREILGAYYDFKEEKPNDLIGINIAEMVLNKNKS